MAKNKKEVKPLPIWLGLVLVAVAIMAMVVFLVYLINPPESTLGNGELSAVGGFSEEANSDPDVSYGEVIDIENNTDLEGGLKINAEVNDIIVFGSYNNEPIQWIVADKQGEELLLVSRYCLDVLPYNNERASVEWLESSLSKWLCGEFYNSVFSDGLKDLVIDGANTGKVFILSQKEASACFEYDTWRMAMPTAALAAQKGLSADKALCQWLRDSGNIANSASYIYFDGSIRNQGYAVDYDEVGVRPAVWIKTGYETEDTTESSLLESAN